MPNNGATHHTLRSSQFPKPLINRPSKMKAPHPHVTGSPSVNSTGHDTARAWPKITVFKPEHDTGLAFIHARARPPNEVSTHTPKIASPPHISIFWVLGAIPMVALAVCKPSVAGSTFIGCNP